MKITVLIGDSKKQVVLNKNMTVNGLFEKMGLVKENYLAKREGELLLLEDELAEGDNIRLFKVISGG